MMVHGCNTNSGNAEAEELNVQGQSGYRDAVSKTVLKCFTNNNMYFPHSLMV